MIGKNKNLNKGGKKFKSKDAFRQELSEKKRKILRRPSTSSMLMDPVSSILKNSKLL